MCGTDTLGLALRAGIASTTLGNCVCGLVWAFLLWIYVTDIQFAGFIVFAVYAPFPAKGICKNSHYKGQWR